MPLLYIGTNGEPYGEFYNGSAAAPIHTSTSVTDGKWHYAVISGSSNTQSLYLDGTQAGSSLRGQINQLNMAVDTIGAGFWNGWPEDNSTAASYFNGDIGQVAVYPRPSSAASPELTQVTLPSGKTEESAGYDPATGGSPRTPTRTAGSGRSASRSRPATVPRLTASGR